MTETWQTISTKTLALVAEYDDRFIGLDEDQLMGKVQAWSFQIKAAALQLDDCLEGVRRAYSQAKRPTNPVGAVVEEAKQARKIRSSGSEVKALPASSSPKTGMYGEPIAAAYEHDGAGYIHCPVCDADPGDACEQNGKALKIPHTKRLAIAYRENNPEGIRRRQEREQHLREHRKTYKPPWLRRNGEALS